VPQRRRDAAGDGRGAALPAGSAAVGEVGQITLMQSRRLHLVCEQSGATGLLVRRRFYGREHSRKQGGSAATTRWRIRSAPTETNAPGLGDPRWQLELLYRRGGAPASFLVEWNEEERGLRVVTDAQQPSMRDVARPNICMSSREFVRIRCDHCNSLRPIPKWKLGKILGPGRDLATVLLAD
jgi:hypothetical protein